MSQQRHHVEAETAAEGTILIRYCWDGEDPMDYGEYLAPGEPVTDETARDLAAYALNNVSSADPPSMCRVELVDVTALHRIVAAGIASA